MGAAESCSGGCNHGCIAGGVSSQEWRLPSRQPPCDDVVSVQSPLYSPNRTVELFRAIGEDGLNVRTGLELSAPVVRKVPEGAVFQVFARQVNLRGIERLRTVDGWTSLRAASDGRLIAEPVPARCPADKVEEEDSPLAVDIAFAGRRSSKSPRSVRFAEDIAEIRDAQSDENAPEDEAFVAALIDDAAPWLFGHVLDDEHGDEHGEAVEY